MVDRMDAGYDPFARGPFPVGVRTIEATDAARDCVFGCEIWYPASAQHAGRDRAPDTQDAFTVPPGDARRQMAVRHAEAEPGTYPLVLFSHHSGGHRRAAAFLCTHLSSHGYVVAALDHSEVAALERARRDGAADEQKAAFAEAVGPNRVLDLILLLDRVLSHADLDPQTRLDPARIGAVGHSLGGWTVLASASEDTRIRAVVALAPGGNSNPRPGILRLKLTFDRHRDVPTLYLVAENDVCLPLDGMYEIFERTPSARQMVILRRADHMHFMDNVEAMHEMVRAMTFPPELAWLQQEMRPISELCSGEQAHLFVRGLTLCHMDAVLKQHAEARRVLDGAIDEQLAKRGVDVLLHRS